MAHAIGLRATSLGVSTVLIGLAVIAALSASHTIIPWIAPPAPPPIASIEPPAPPPDPIEPKAEPPRTPVREIVDIPVQRIIAIDTEPQLTDVLVETVTETGGPVEITAPSWVRRPSDLAQYYPRRAITRGIEGVVELSCIVRVTGALDCTAISETPPGWGFAPAAVRISRDHRMVPAQRGGEAVEGRYRMRVPFTIG
jgi:periplasmic protein TonB